MMSDDVCNNLPKAISDSLSPRIVKSTCHEAWAPFLPNKSQTGFLNDLEEVP